MTRRCCCPYFCLFVLSLLLCREGIERKEVENLVIGLLDYCAFLPNRMCLVFGAFSAFILHLDCLLFSLAKPVHTFSPESLHVVIFFNLYYRKTNSFAAQPSTTTNFKLVSTLVSRSHSRSNLRTPSTHTNGTGYDRMVLKCSLHPRGVSQF